MSVPAVSQVYKVGRSDRCFVHEELSLGVRLEGFRVGGVGLGFSVPDSGSKVEGRGLRVEG